MDYWLFADHLPAPSTTDVANVKDGPNDHRPSIFLETKVPSKFRVPPPVELEYSTALAVICPVELTEPVIDTILLLISEESCPVIVPSAATEKLILPLSVKNPVGNIMLVSIG